MNKKHPIYLYAHSIIGCSFYIWSCKWNSPKLWIYFSFNLTDVTLKYYKEILSDPTFLTLKGKFANIYYFFNLSGDLAPYLQLHWYIQDIQKVSTASNQTT